MPPIDIHPHLHGCVVPCCAHARSRMLVDAGSPPDTLTVALNINHPPQFTAKKLMQMALELPVDWIEQRKLLGFR